MRPARILVVDDEPGMLRAVERVLGRQHQVEGATSAAAALERAAQWRPELAILDIRMPDLDGFQLMARLREGVPDLDVILMTGSMSDPDQKLVRAIRENAFYFIQKPFDNDVLKTLVERCLELRRLAEDNRRHTALLEAELAGAQAFQRGLLPPAEARLGPVSVACWYAPCLELGGDFYDYARAGAGRVALLIADVSGHGVSAAMLTGIVKSSFHAAQADAYDPLAVVHRASDGLRAFAADQFVTLVAVRVDPRAARIEYVNAGHPAALMWRDGDEPAELASTGPIVSPAFPDVAWEKIGQPWKRGDRLLLYTDGITEARSHSGEMFGPERVAGVARRSPAGGKALIAELLAEVDRFVGGRPQPDDLTLLTAECP